MSIREQRDHSASPATCFPGVDKFIHLSHQWKGRSDLAHPSKANVFQESWLIYKESSRHSHNPKHTQVHVLTEFNDTQTGMLLGIPRSARCVQRFDDSLNSAIHITYRISLRSSSMREPRDPLLKVVLLFFSSHSVQQSFMYVKKIIDNLNNARLPTSSAQVERMKKTSKRKRQCAHALTRGPATTTSPPYLSFISIMILPQVHLRKPCYDFYFL